MFPAKAPCDVDAQCKNKKEKIFPTSSCRFIYIAIEHLVTCIEMCDSNICDFKIPYILLYVTSIFTQRAEGTVIDYKDPLAHIYRLIDNDTAIL